MTSKLDQARLLLQKASTYLDALNRSEPTRVDTRDGPVDVHLVKAINIAALHNATRDAIQLLSQSRPAVRLPDIPDYDAGASSASLSADPEPG